MKLQAKYNDLLTTLEAFKEKIEKRGFVDKRGESTMFGQSFPDVLEFYEEVKAKIVEHKAPKEVKADGKK